MFSLNLDHCDAGATELDVLVVVVGDAGEGAEVLTDSEAEGAGAGAVEDADLGHGEEDGIVEEVHHGLEGFVGTHASDVDLLLELLAALTHHIDGSLADGVGQMGIGRTGGFALDLVLGDGFEAADIDVALDETEGYLTLTATDGEDFACGLLAFEADEGAGDKGTGRTHRTHPIPPS